MPLLTDLFLNATLLYYNFPVQQTVRLIVFVHVVYVPTSKRNAYNTDRCAQSIPRKRILYIPLYGVQL
jgi:hypothetical protein